MLVIFAVIIGGIIAGRLLSSWRLVFVSRMITVIIWLLLFLLGLEVGSDPAVVGGMATLGRTAFVIFACSVAGSICMSWLLWRCVRRGTASRPPAEGMPEQAGAVAAGIEAPQPRVTTSAGTGMPGPAVGPNCERIALTSFARFISTFAPIYACTGSKISALAPVSTIAFSMRSSSIVSVASDSSMTLICEQSALSASSRGLIVSPSPSSAV